MSSRPTHTGSSPDNAINEEPNLRTISNDASTSNKSSAGEIKEAREEGEDAHSATTVRSVGEDKDGDLESVDTEHGRNQSIGVAKIEALYRAFGDNKVAVWILYLALGGE